MAAFIDKVEVLRHELRELEAEQHEIRQSDGRSPEADMIARAIDEHVIEIIALGGDPDT